MTVSTETPILSSTANGVTTVFPYPFTVLQAADLKVTGTLAGVVTLYTLGVHYSLTGVGTNSGSVVFLVAPASSIVITRYRDSVIARSTDYQDNGDFLADTVNLDFDRLYLLLQEIFNGGKGVPTAVRVPNSETIPALPPAADRANRLLGFDGAGNPLTVAPIAGDATSLAADIASSAAAGKGAGQVGFAYALAYGAGTIGKWLKDLALAAGSTFMGWVQAGTGGVTRTVSDKLREQVSFFDFMTAAQVADVTSFTGAIDVTAACQAAFNTGKRVEMPLGSYYVTDLMTMQNGQVLQGHSRTKSYFKVTQTFNMAATGVLRLGTGEPGAQVYDVGFSFNQPDQSVRANCVQYPWAIDGNAIPRFVVDRVRVSGGWRGIDARNNSGGSYIGFVEIGALSSGIEFDGALDFAHGGHWHLWPFGMGPTLLGSVWADGVANAVTFGLMDGTNIDSISTFQQKIFVTSAASANIPVQIGKLQADGDGARLIVQGGLVSVGQMYSTKTAAPTVDTVDVSAGQCTIGTFCCKTGLSAAELHTSGTGTLQVNGGYLNSNNPAFAVARSDGGLLCLDGAYFDMAAIAFTQAHCVQASGSLQVRNCKWKAPGVGSGPSILFVSDNAKNIATDNDTSTWGAVNMAGPLGVYGPNRDLVRSFTPSVSFTTNGTFAPTYVIQAGRFRPVVGGYWVELRIVFNSNAYTGASGNFQITGLPAIKGGIDSTGWPVGKFGNVTLSAGNTVLTGNVTLATSTITLLQSGSGIAASTIGTANVPASTNNIEFAFNGFVPTF